MTYAETVLPVFDQETANTRKVLERIPDDMRKAGSCWLSGGENDSFFDRGSPSFKW